MKKLNIKYFAVLIILFIVGCEAPTVGYNTYEWGKDYKFSLGTDESIETAMAFNKAWDERDFETMGEEKPELAGTVTVRDRDTMEQKRMPVEELLQYVTDMCRN